MGKGVSAAEKKERLLAVFHEGVGVFSSKEILKAKVSFPSQAIEQVLNELVSDDLVVRSWVLKSPRRAHLTASRAYSQQSARSKLCSLQTEGKIGGAKYFWSFPGEQRTKKTAALSQGQATNSNLQAQLQEATRKAEEARAASGQSADDAARVRDAEEGIAIFKQREAAAVAEKERLLKASSSNMAVRAKDLPVLRDSANRWTDNLFELDKYMQEKFGMEKVQVQKQLGTANMDYIE